MAVEKRIRPRPTLPHSCPCSTIGAERLNFRVRNGNGCDPFAIATENVLSLRPKPQTSPGADARREGQTSLELHSEHEHPIRVKMCNQALGRLVPVS